MFGGWDGYKWKGSGSEVKKEVPWFEARRKCCMNILKRNIVSCDVSLGCDHRTKTRCYEILGLGGKSSFKIVDRQGALVAEVSLSPSPTHARNRCAICIHIYIYII